MMMKHLALSLLLLTSLCCVCPTAHGEPAQENSTQGEPAIGAADWPWWRGPHRNGVAAADQTPPLKWSDTENVLWKTPVPGRGHGSPTVVGRQIFLATADTSDQTQSVLCFDRETGRELWRTVVHRGGLEIKGNRKASLASSSVACDGQRLFINFLNDGAVYTTSLDRNGKQLWQTKITDYVVHQGFGSSPTVFGSLVLVSADNKGGGAVAAFDRESGKVVWKHDRPKKPNYASPIILDAAGRQQLVFTGCDLVASFDPRSGKKLWEIEGSTTECVTSVVTDGQLVFTSGGYPKNHVAAIHADGSGKTAWEINTRVYVPSMLVHEGYLYAVADGGIAMCWKAATGEAAWKGRIRGTFTASPVLVGDKIFATNEKGTTYIFKAQPDSFELLGQNQLGDQVYPTPTFVGSRIYMRVADKQNDDRQEMLYAIGKPDSR